MWAGQTIWQNRSWAIVGWPNKIRPVMSRSNIMANRFRAVGGHAQSNGAVGFGPLVIRPNRFQDAGGLIMSSTKLWVSFLAKFLIEIGLGPKYYIGLLFIGPIYTGPTPTKIYCAASIYSTGPPMAQNLLDHYISGRPTSSPKSIRSLYIVRAHQQPKNNWTNLYWARPPTA